MEQRFKQEHDWILAATDRSNLILAVSGGVDSVVMAHLFAKLGRDFSIAHCNFQLRGKDAAADEQFVKDLADSLNKQFLVERFETAQYSSDHGISIQMAARELRYNWFRAIAEHDKALVATAHHANDTAETMVFNLAKGTGLAGLHGIRKIRDCFVRPMLWATKQEILDFALQNRISWREDASNQSDYYHRNLIRNKVVPELESINPGFAKATARTAMRVTEVEELLQYAIKTFRITSNSGDSVLLDIATLQKLPGLATVLFELLKVYGFSYDQAQQIGQSLNTVGALFHSREWLLNIDREKLILVRKGNAEIETVINRDDRLVQAGELVYSVELKPATGYTISESSKVAAFDAAKLSFPLQIRTIQEGDNFYPLGMSGKKKVSDFLIDIKMSVIDKKRQQVVVAGNDIVWVTGQRLDNRYKITPATNRVLELSVNKLTSES